MIARTGRFVATLLLGRIAVGSLSVVERGSRRRVWRPRADRDRGGSRGSRLADAAARVSRVGRRLRARVWDSPDMVALIRVAALNARGMDRVRARLAPLLAPVRALGAIARRSTRTRRRQDIAAHYDLGNGLFERMLDPTLSYSCAVFEHAHATLVEAQMAKLELVFDKLELGPGDRVLEIGTGWGAFAVHAAATRGCEVTTTTISRAQYDCAVARVRRAGLEDRVTVLLEDYRDLTGSYDKLVSIEMIEAVGWRHLGVFFAKCSELLASHGVMLLQAITIDDRAYEVEKGARSFINTRIFPGGCLPSLEVIAHSVARRTDMQAIDLEDIAGHYVETLRRWRRRFGANAHELASLGYDERFRRLWTLYLCYCEAGFAERRICDVQLLLAKPRWRATPSRPRLRSETGPAVRGRAA